MSNDNRCQVCNMLGETVELRTGEYSFFRKVLCPTHATEEQALLDRIFAPRADKQHRRG